MGRDIAIETTHGLIDGWLAEPEGAPRGGILVLQEIFGVNEHIRAVTDRFAAHGYRALAPSLFDPVHSDVELDYDEAGMQRGVALRDAVGFDRAAAIAEAASRRLRSDGLKVGAVGYCWGGTIALLANTRSGLPAVGYYGSRTFAFSDEPLRAPMLFHFGAEDPSTPVADIEQLRDKYPDADVHIYPGAKHAFNRDVDNTHYHPESAALALKRSLAFFDEHLS